MPLPDQAPPAEQLLYMCGVDFQHHLYDDTHGTKLYPSIEALRKRSPCVDQCGIVAVRVELVRWEQGQDFSRAATQKAAPEAVPVIDIPRMERALAGPRVTMPPGLSPEEQRAFILGAGAAFEACSGRTCPYPSSLPARVAAD